MQIFKECEKIICINVTDIMTNSLTMNKVYTVLPKRFPKREEDNKLMVWILNDKGVSDFFLRSRFISVIEKRCEIIDGILK